MAKKIDQNWLLLGITLSAGLVFLVLWGFFLEEFIFVSLLGMEITKTSLERWEFIIFGVLLIGISLIAPIRKIKQSSKQLALTQNALDGEQTLSKVFFNVDNSIILVVDPTNQIMQINQRASELLGQSLIQVFQDDLSTSSLHVALAELYLEANAIDISRERVDAILKVFPANGYAKLVSAKVLVAQDNEQAGREALAEALEIWSDADADYTYSVESRSLMNRL